MQPTLINKVRSGPESWKLDIPKWSGPDIPDIHISADSPPHRQEPCPPGTEPKLVFVPPQNPSCRAAIPYCQGYYTTVCSFSSSTKPQLPPLPSELRPLWQAITTRSTLVPHGSTPSPVHSTQSHRVSTSSNIEERPTEGTNANVWPTGAIVAAVLGSVAFIGCTVAGAVYLGRRLCNNSSSNGTSQAENRNNLEMMKPDSTTRPFLNKKNDLTSTQNNLDKNVNSSKQLLQKK